MYCTFLVRGFLRSLLVLLLWSRCDGRDSELSYVTCGSLVKLLNTRHNVRLHSHDVKYGSGTTRNLDTAQYHQNHMGSGVTVEMKHSNLIPEIKADMKREWNLNEEG